MAEQAAIGQDVVDVVEALRIEQCALSGFDWGLRAACITSLLHPALVKGFIAIGGYSVQNTIDKAEPAPAMRAARMWYQWYFNTEQGRVGLEQNRRDIVRYLWETWAPTLTPSPRTGPLGFGWPRSLISTRALAPWGS